MKKNFLPICDDCCDKIGLLKECHKSGGCTCEVCGWSQLVLGKCDLSTVNLVNIQNIRKWDILDKLHDKWKAPIV